MSERSINLFHQKNKTLLNGYRSIYITDRDGSNKKPVSNLMYDWKLLTIRHLGFDLISS